jgi:hypothetical protein
MYDIDQDGPNSFSVWYVPSYDLDAPRLHMASFFRTNAAARRYIKELETHS